jgi:hypothetical protein
MKDEPGEPAPVYRKPKSDDALILPHRANPAGLNFRERQGTCLACAW